jgi:hydrogenase nickel incorporation protein HypA/HybF
MHEMSLAQSLLAIVRQEVENHGSPRLVGVTVRRGALANVVPEALDMAFEVLTVGTDMEGVVLTQVEEPVRLSCGGCGREFAPEASPAARFSPCPFCGEEFGHLVLAGKELYLDHLEVE